jgi:hypothetical protein
MKTTLLLLAFSVQSLILFGQPYQSIFSTDTTRWNVYECVPDAGGTIVYYSFSDTLINQKLYHKLFRENIYSADQELGLAPYLCGFVHEDTVVGKYWFLKIDNDEQKEVLFMDLSLSKGDSLAIISDFRFMWTDSVVVDSVYYLNDKKIIAIDKSHYDCYDENKVKFIEGIGSTNGFYMGEWYEQPEPYTLLCKFENNLKTYSIDKEWFSNCYHEGGAGINDSEFGNSILIYPNPSIGKIFIKTENYNSNFTYTIFNSIGQIVSKGEFFDSSKELSLTKNGLYFIKISNNDIQTTKKVLIYGY